MQMKILCSDDPLLPFPPSSLPGRIESETLHQGGSCASHDPLHPR